MDTRPRTRLLRRALVVTALGALVVPATADAATKTKLPVITKVAPKTLYVGETMVITGKNFRVGKNKNTVMFKRDGGKALFVKGGLATKRQIALVIPKSLEKYMAIPAGSPVATRFRLRVLTTKLSKSFTAIKSSPTIGPEKPKVVEAPQTPTSPDGDCDGDMLLNSVDPDDDNDLLSDADEAALKLDPCSGDTDLDGVEDGYEYQSAFDLNNDDYRHANYITPSRARRRTRTRCSRTPTPTMTVTGLTLGDEYKLWKYTYEVNHTATRTLAPLSYSDGAQYSLSQLAGPNGDGIRQPTMTVSAYQPPRDFRLWADGAGYGVVQLTAIGGGPRSPYDLYDMNRSGGAPTTVRALPQRRAEATYWDLDTDGFVSDDERDDDADGLNNYEVSGGPMSPIFWKGCYPEDGEYPIKYAGTKPYDADSDGDKVLDGADDQDFDGIPNIMELSRNMAGNVALNGTCGAGGNTNPLIPMDAYVNPFNPCLPDIDSRTCQRHPVIGKGFAPYIDDWEPLISN